MNLKDVSDGLGDILSCYCGYDIFTKTASQTNDIFVFILFMELPDNIRDNITHGFFSFDCNDFLQYFPRDCVLNWGDNLFLIFCEYKDVLFFLEFVGGRENFEGVAWETFAIMFGQDQSGKAVFDDWSE